MIEQPKEKVFITGVSSFIGANLALTLSKDFDVWGSARIIGNRPPHTQQRLDFLKEKLANPIINLDLTNEDSIKEACNQVKPDIWIHHGGYAKNYASNETFDFNASLEINVKPLEPLFRALSNNGCRYFLATGTAAEYSDSDEIHREEESCHPKTFYGLSKLLQTHSIETFASFYKVPSAVIRVFNLFGEFENPGKLFNLLKNSITSQAPIELSSCEQRRSLLSVDQVTEIYRQVLLKREALGEFEIFNAVNEGCYSLKDFLELEPRHRELFLFGKREMRKDEVPIQVGSSKKINTLLGLNFSLNEVQNELQKFLEG